MVSRFSDPEPELEGGDILEWFSECLSDVKVYE